MNGILGALPNSHRKIEPEIMRQMMADIHIDNIINSGENNIQQSIVTGSKLFSDEMLGSASENVMMSNSIFDLLIEYYLATYEILKYRKPFREGHENSRIIPIKMKQFTKFITQDGNINCYPGQVQFFFSHKIDLPDGELEHNLAFI
ncbi:hypothetical protein RhiirC2_798259 [Rhizophagus irregularis]|uniref:Uncharacterized protein n=1 Tax=Rhizophagus irregularis TaxID=588596 RepID=A0A2N1M6S8_9GLOM|nr:hypothetical protein RhiirC2_798259 [Rhizophagus irregularis]